MVKQIALVLVLVSTLNVSSFGQSFKTAGPLSSVPLKALSYFEQVEGQQFDDYLRRIRPVALAPELRTRVLSMLPKADMVAPSAQGLAKLKALDSILRYHQRDAVIELKVLRVPTATALFVAGAAVLITESALEMLTAEELQAVVAHELGHEYYWSRFELARQNHQYSELQELELRCDGIAVVTLQHIGVDPENLISAITKLNRQNERHGSSGSQNYVAFEERIRFIRLMADRVRARNTARVN